MSETKDKETKTLSLGGKSTLSLKGGTGGAAGGSQLRQSLGQGRSKSVAVEVRRSKRTGTGEDDAGQASGEGRQLTNEEREARFRALRDAENFNAHLAKKLQERSGEVPEGLLPDTATAPAAPKNMEGMTLRERELEEMRLIEEEEARIRKLSEPPAPRKPVFTAPAAGARPGLTRDDEAEEESYRAKMKRSQEAKTPSREPTTERRGGRITVTQALNQDLDRERGPSMAARRRAKEKARLAAMDAGQQQKVYREITLPETITVQDLANRMSERGVDVIKTLMKMGVMATITQTLDADTAELVATEMGHKVKRVTEGDVEQVLEAVENNPEDLITRPPVVTIMGHVDHGKTSLLDALRETNVVAGEAGGITQHIGAYQVTRPNGQKITFLDTPGHAAFTEMRARGANITDIVVLVVAANDGIMPQTIEAINHAKAAKVPLIVAINKIDLPDADPSKVKTALLQYEIIVEDMGGETLCIEVSAKKRLHLDKLEEAILLQSEVLDMKANPKRLALGTVVEAKMEQGRGNVATVLIQQGTLRIGDMFVVGSEWGRVRALMNDQGRSITEALPGQPVEVLGLAGAPEAGDQVVVTRDESKAREISAYRQRKKREVAAMRLRSGLVGSLEDIMAKTKEGEKKQLAVIIKGDVHGSVEAIIGSLKKIEDENPDDISIRVLHSGVGGITESDITLARATNALIVGFNVRANGQARALAERDGVDIRYYNIIYNVIDDAKAILSGLLAPAVREEYLGQAEIREVFNITKVGKVAGCVVTIGTVKRGAKVRLLRDNVVIHEGTLKTLKRFKDEVKDVKEGTECGMAFENYDDIRAGDIIECFMIVEEARTVS
jgi:translation initiation factor IF-2